MTLEKWEEFRSIDFSPDSSNDKLKLLESEKFNNLFYKEYPKGKFND